MLNFFRKNKSSEVYHLPNQNSAENQPFESVPSKPQAPRAEDEFSTVSKIKILVALMIVGFGVYAAYWAQQPVSEVNQIKADVLDSQKVADASGNAVAATPPPAANPPSANPPAAQNDQKVVDPSGANPPAQPADNAAAQNAAPNPADKLKVSIVDFAFNPPLLAIDPGQTVTWTNNDTVPHTVTADDFNSQTLNPGETFSYTFAKAGKFTYKCSFHPQMTGEIDVGNIAAAGQNQVNPPSAANDPNAAQSSSNSANLHNSAASAMNAMNMNGSNLKPAALDAPLDTQNTSSSLSGDLVASSQSQPLQPLSTTTSKIVRSTRIPSSGPEDFVYAGVLGIVLVVNRKKLLRA